MTVTIQQLALSNSFHSQAPSPTIPPSKLHHQKTRSLTDQSITSIHSPQRPLHSIIHLIRYCKLINTSRGRSGGDRCPNQSMRSSLIASLLQQIHNINSGRELIKQFHQGKEMEPWWSVNEKRVVEGAVVEDLQRLQRSGD